MYDSAPTQPGRRAGVFTPMLKRSNRLTLIPTQTRNRPMATRRDFLKKSTAALGAATLGSAGWSTDAAAASARRGMGPVTITDVDVYYVGAALFVRVRTSEGLAGWGEADRAGAPAVVARLITQFADAVIGRDLFDAEPLWTDLYFRADDMGRGGLLTAALSGIDLALWDARGKILELPCHRLLGGAYRQEILVYGSFSRDGGENTPSDMARRAAQFVEWGFKAVKARMDLRQYGVDPDPDPTFPVVREIRAAIGDDVPLYVDANNGYSAARAITVGRQLRDLFGVQVFEEPVGYTNYADHAEVAAALPGIEVSAGEHEYTRWQFRDLIVQGRPDVVNPDLLRAGGLTEGKKIAALAEAFDLPIAVHSTRPTLGTAAHLQFAATALRADRPQEHPGLDKATELWDLFENRFELENGVVSVPQRPGIGLSVNEAAVERAARSI